ncbi:MAG: sigma-70 family RNA polymerase sigma factor [Planctomycetes bacterium]|nr:sigma-70 family RNA polymerase sigma factor [Planctomycetota bacterium]
MSDVTRILNAIEPGDAKATDGLLPLVYEELRLLAAQKLSHEPPGQTLQATALVHEAYLRLVGDGPQSWNSRGHFFAAAAEAMRRILVENARRRKSAKQGGDRQRIGLTDADPAAEAPSDDLLALDEALTQLSAAEPAMADLVKLRYFAGLTIEQVARIQGISRRSVIDHWAYARSWLARQIARDGKTPPP